jgi:hypothetical protein
MEYDAAAVLGAERDALEVELALAAAAVMALVAMVAVLGAVELDA